MTRKLLYLNGIAILIVVLFHAGGWGLISMFSWAHRYGATPAESLMNNPIAYYVLRAIEQTAVFSIPSFLFVSGFFVAFTLPATSKTIRWDNIFTRLKFLVIPYLIWAFIKIIMLILEGSLPGWVETGKLLLTGSITPAYYFVILLVQMYLLAPFLIRWAKNRPLLMLAVTAVLQICFHSLQYITILDPQSVVSHIIINTLPKWFFPVRLFWFSLGILVCLHRKEISHLFEGKTMLWGSLTVVFWLFGFFEWEFLTTQSGITFIEHRETLVDALYAFVFIMMILSLQKKSLLQQKTIEKVGGLSFGIYLAHVPVMEIIGRGIYHVAPFLLSYHLVFTLMIAIIGLAVPLLMINIVKRSPLNRFYVYLFG